MRCRNNPLYMVHPIFGVIWTLLINEYSCITPNAGLKMGAVAMC